ncbi:hypothetical protein [Aquimarina algiphila]|uniref:hypothetical protein n=1 Tax=Aquimarina algiphila TaxID=2047982 RepID=UPI00232F9784|nr:hypothetical protein [Aquimarina algiphila]
MSLNCEKFYELEFYNSFVIVTIFKDVLLTLNKANIVREEIKSYYKSKDFIMITNRKFRHEVSDEVFRQGQPSNMRGLAIVSKEKTERDIALIQQKLYDKSFAFFTTLEEAKSWAEGYFIN